MRKIKVKGLMRIAAAMLLFVMLAAAWLPVFAASISDVKENIDQNSDGRIDYLALGSSAAAGKGVDENAAYPVVIKDTLIQVGKDASLENLAIPGMRVEELRVILDASFKGDSYTEEHFLGDEGVFADLGGIESLREQYIKAVLDAEIITFDFGLDNFFAYALDYTINGKYDADLSVFDEGVQKTAEILKGNIKETLIGFIGDAEDEELARRLIDGVTYALISYAVSFDAVIEDIYRLNPDAVITVVNIRNPLFGLDADTEAFGASLSLSEIYGTVVDGANAYMASLSAYANCFYFAYADEDAVKTLEPGGALDMQTGEIDSLAVLPDASGHKAIADAFVFAMANAKRGRDVLKNDMNGVYSSVFGVLDREMLVGLEYTFSPRYVLDPTRSYYVALGDGSASDQVNGYVTQIAKEYGLHGSSGSSHKYTNLAKDELTPADLLDPTNESYIEKHIATLKRADLITVSFNNSAAITYMFERVLTVLKGGTPEELDWGNLIFGLNMVIPDIEERIDSLIEMLKAELLSSMESEKIADMLVAAIEGYLYEYISRIINFNLLIDKIRDINMKAQVVVIGSYNDMRGVTFRIDGEEFPIGDYIGYLVDAANLEILVFSALGEKTAYISCPEIETKLGGVEIDIDLSDMSILHILSIVGKIAPLVDCESYNPAASGHTAIAGAVLDNIKLISGPHSCNSATDFDSDCDNRCNVCAAKRSTRGHKFSSVCTVVCEVEGCDARNPDAVFHTYSAPCDVICDICENVRQAAEHSYNGECDESCGACGDIRTGIGAHSFGEWKEEGKDRVRACTICGEYEREAISEDDSIGIIIIVAAASLAILGGGAAVYFFVIKKKLPLKKENQN